MAVEQAWAELAAVEREQEAARAERLRVERQLEQVRLRGAQLEQVGPTTYTNYLNKNVYFRFWLYFAYICVGREILCTPCNHF